MVEKSRLFWKLIPLKILMCRRIGDLVNGSSSLDFISNLTSLNVLYATCFFSIEHTVLYLGKVVAY
jgi:hypothetical protein